MGTRARERGRYAPRVSALPVLHVITDDDILRSPDFLARASEVLAAIGARGALHIRGHHTSARLLYDIAVSLAPHAARAGALLVVNDRADVALAAGAGGVQVGQRSFSVSDVRRIAPGLLVGESVHSAARAQGDWVIAGHVFETPTHAAERPRGLEFVRAVAERAGAPVIAIGGVKVSDVEPLQRAGAYGVAIIRGIWHAADSARAARDYLYFFG
jgi:thiazole tautomerase (transcriptional regulator TenI)